MAARDVYVKGFLFLALAVCLLVFCAPFTPAEGGNARICRPMSQTGPGESGTPCVDSDAVIRIACENGLRARIHPAAYLARSMRGSEGNSELVLDNGEALDVITDINDSLIAVKGDGSFHPFDESYVARALQELAYPGLDIEVDVYILPVPRRSLPESSTRGSEIFLSPHTRELSYDGTAFIVAHEIGHAFQNRYLPLQDASRWSKYERLRGIGDGRVFRAVAEHAYRPVEICAEDFRVLFGGRAARYDGRVENPELCSPLFVPGLEGFFLSLGDGDSRHETVVSLDRASKRRIPQTAVPVRSDE
jgi:hypothetical protein